MERDEPHGRDGADGLKNLPFKCCACRSTYEHRCYMCLCGKCPLVKKVPSRSGVKDFSCDPRPSTATEKRGNQVGWADKAGSASTWCTSSENKPLGNASASGWGTSPSGNQERKTDRSGSIRVTWVDRRHAAEPYSSRDDQRMGGQIDNGCLLLQHSHTGNKEVMDNNPEDGSSRPILRTPHVESGSRSPSHAGNRSKGDPEWRAYRVEDVSSGPVKRPKVIHRIVANSAEDGSSRSVLVKPNIPSGLTRARSAEKESRGSLISINLEGVVRADKKFLNSAVESPLYLKTPLTVVSEEQEVYCSPANESTWKGNFKVVNFPYKMEGFVAHPAAKISAKAYGFARKMSGNLKFEMHHRECFIPEAFKTYCDAGDIALYFYPQKRSESSKKEYSALLKHLTEQRQMLRSVIGRLELLVFSSKLLCPTSQRDRGQYFMWGVFRKIWSDEDACIS